MKEVTTVSIGIPAYNEGKNIQKLLLALLAQKEVGIQIKEILVVSDGSSDDTEKKVKAVRDKRIHFIEDHKRLGKSARLQQIFHIFKSDILILADADIVISDHTVISRSIKKARLAKSGLAGVNALPLPAKTFFEHVIETGVTIMKDISGQWNGGNNYLSFKGCFLLLDGTFARSLNIPAAIVNNDPYLYFAAIEKGYKPTYVRSSKIFYRSPKTLTDHIKQSSRYQSSRTELATYFNLDWDKEYTMPVAIIVTSIIKSIVTRPLYFFPYLVVNVVSKLKKQTNIKSTWSIASTTK